MKLSLIHNATGLQLLILTQKKEKCQNIEIYHGMKIAESSNMKINCCKDKSMCIKQALTGMALKNYIWSANGHMPLWVTNTSC